MRESADCAYFFFTKPAVVGPALGNMTRNVEPRPTALSTRICPPCSPRGAGAFLVEGGHPFAGSVGAEHRIKVAFDVRGVRGSEVLFVVLSVAR